MQDNPLAGGWKLDVLRTNRRIDSVDKGLPGILGTPFFEEKVPPHRRIPDALNRRAKRRLFHLIEQTIDRLRTKQEILGFYLRFLAGERLQLLERQLDRLTGKVRSVSALKQAGFVGV